MFATQKFRCNAEPAVVNDDLNNDTTESVFDKIKLEETNHEENDRGDVVAAALAAAVAQPPTKAIKKKIVSAMRFFF